MRERLGTNVGNTLSLPSRQEPSFSPLGDADSDIIRCEGHLMASSQKAVGARREGIIGDNMDV